MLSNDFFGDKLLQRLSLDYRQLKNIDCVIIKVELKYQGFVLLEHCKALKHMLSGKHMSNPIGSRDIVLNTLQNQAVSTDKTT